VIYKLLGFTLAMIAGPIGTYFLTLNTVFKGMTASPVDSGLSDGQQEIQPTQVQLQRLWQTWC